MNAVVFERPHEFRLRALEEPEPGAGEVLVKVVASMVCLTDHKILDGRFPVVTFPHIPGHEWSGRVLALGPGVGDLDVGDEVGVETHAGCGYCPRCLEGMYVICDNFGNREAGHRVIGITAPGGLADYCCVPRKVVHRLPAGVSVEDAAFTDVLGIAIHAVERSGLVPGETVAVVGPGAMGLLAVQVARRMGASHIAAVGTRPERLKLAELSGADVCVNVNEAGDVVAAVKNTFSGKGPDVVIEFAGTERAATQSIQMVRRGGRVVLAGSTGIGNELKGVDLSLVIRGHITIAGSVAAPAGVARRGLDMLAQGLIDVRPIVTDHFELTEFGRGWETFLDRESGSVRVMFHPRA